MKEKSPNIILTGFRATGKSSVGRMLAGQLHYRFIDADDLLCERLGAPIAEIVAHHGWPFFRQAEAQLLGEVPAMTRTVLATGGGAIEHEEQWRKLRDECLVVWLDADVATITRRMRDDPNSPGQRPSVTGTSVYQEIEGLLHKRRPLYAAGSDVRIDTVGREPEELVELILVALRKRLHATEG